MFTNFWRFVIRPPVAIIKSAARLILFSLETYNLYSIASKLTGADRRLIWFPNTGVRKANRQKLLTFYCMRPLNWNLRPSLIMPTTSADSLFATAVTARVLGGYRHYRQLIERLFVGMIYVVTMPCTHDWAHSQPSSVCSTNNHGRQRTVRLSNNHKIIRQSQKFFCTPQRVDIIALYCIG